MEQELLYGLWVRARSFIFKDMFLIDDFKAKYKKFAETHYYGAKEDCGFHWRYGDSFHEYPSCYVCDICCNKDTFEMIKEEYIVTPHRRTLERKDGSVKKYKVTNSYVIEGRREDA